MAQKDFVAVTPFEMITFQISRWPKPVMTDFGVEVSTHCLFESGSTARVMVVPKGGGFIVHDQGQGIEEFTNEGGDNPRAIAILKSHFRDRGIAVSVKGEIMSPCVLADEIAPTIALIANASIEASHLLLSKWKPRLRRNFKRLLKQILETEFAQSHPKQSVKVLGSSLKQHTFDFSLDSNGGRLILMDAVHNDANSISSAVLRNLDVKNAHRPDFEQRIVYDETEDWRAEDLNLLRLGAKAVPIRRIPEVLSRLAA